MPLQRQGGVRPDLSQIERLPNSYLGHQPPNPHGGIDGRIYFDGNKGDNLESMILEVKGGKSVSQNDLRGLRGALADSGALLAGLVILHPLGQTKERNFKREMARASRITIRGREFAKMQLMTVEELLEGKRFDTPPVLGR